MPDDDQLPTHPLRILGRFVLGGSSVIVLYVLSAGPIYYLLGVRTEALEAALWQLNRPLGWALSYTGTQSYLDPYYLWWWELPGGAFGRMREHPERIEWFEKEAQRYRARERSVE